MTHLSGACLKAPTTYRKQRGEKKDGGLSSQSHHRAVIQQLFERFLTRQIDLRADTNC